MRQGNAYTLDSCAMDFSKLQGYSEHHGQGLGIPEAYITDRNRNTNNTILGGVKG